MEIVKQLDPVALLALAYAVNIAGISLIYWLAERASKRRGGE